MASLLESKIKDQVAAAFKGQLLTGTLRRVVSTSLDSLGDPVPGTATTYSFDGIRESFSAAYAAQAGIPITDVKILVIAGSLSVNPKKDDQIKIEGQWHTVREVLGVDPAGATFELQAYEIEDPTG